MMSRLLTSRIYSRLVWCVLTVVIITSAAIILRNWQISRHKIAASFASSKPMICVLILACDRPSIQRCLESVFKHRKLVPSVNFPIIVSQDCGSHPATTRVLQSYGPLIAHIHQPDQQVISTNGKTKEGYYRQTRHYGWALKEVFHTFKCPHVIVLEDDLEVAPDFFEYFAATLPIYESDKTIFCVTASNMQAKPGRVNRTAYEELHRSDFFFGWGWMMSKRVFHSLGQWPKVFGLRNVPEACFGYWDVWLGTADQRQDRSCIQPEIPRVKNFGREGVSGKIFFDQLVSDLIVSDKFVPFTTMNLSYLFEKTYREILEKKLSHSVLVQDLEQLELDFREKRYPENTTFRVLYHDPLQYKMLTEYFGVLGQTWNGIAHTMYRGILSFMHKHHRFYIAPYGEWEFYKPGIDSLFNG